LNTKVWLKVSTPIGRMANLDPLQIQAES